MVKWQNLNLFEILVTDRLMSIRPSCIGFTNSPIILVDRQAAAHQAGGHEGDHGQDHGLTRR